MTDIMMKIGLFNRTFTAHCVLNAPPRCVSCAVTLRLCAGPEAPKEAAPVVPYAQPGLKAILADAVQWDSFRDFLALGLPGGFMMQLEGNSYDITTLLAGLLGELPGRAQKTASLGVKLLQHIRLPSPELSPADAMPCACSAHAS